MNKIILLGLLCSLFACGTPVRAEAPSEAGDQYLRGYQLTTEGEKAEAAGKTDVALGRYQQALQQISSVAQNSPDWMRDVVQFRLAWLQRKIAQMQGNAAPPVQQPAAPQYPVPSGYPPQVQGFTNQPAATYPPPAPAPGAYNPAPGTVPGVANDPFVTLLAQLRGQLAATQNALTESQNHAAKSDADMKMAQDAYLAMAQRKQQIEAKLSEVGGELSNAIKQKDSLQNELTQAQSVLKTAKQNSSASAESQAQLTKARKDLEELQKEKTVVEHMIADKNAAIDDLKKQLESSQKENKQLAAEKEDLTKKNSELLAQTTQLTNDNKTLSEKIAFLQSSPSTSESYKKLLAENKDLKQKLDDARKQVDVLKASGAKKDAEIAKLKTQITSIQADLAKSQKENTNYQKEVAELTLKLKEMDTDLAKAHNGDGKGNAKTEEENKMLRSIITRQLRHQERQRQAKELVIAEMEHMKNASQTLLDNLQELTATRVMITAEEEPLFTKPQLDLIYSFESSGGNRATLTTRISKNKKDKTTAPEVPGTDPNASAVEKLLAQATQSFEQGDLKGAEIAFEDALRADPKNASVRTSLGDVQIRMKKYDSAEVELQKALAYDPDNATTLYLLGICYYQESRMDDAQNYFHQTIAKKNDNAKAHHYLGMIAWRYGKPAVAESEFKQALAIDPDYADAHYNLAVLYANSATPNLELARQHYKNALEKGISPDANMEKLLNQQTAPAAAPEKPNQAALNTTTTVKLGN